MTVFSAVNIDEGEKNSLCACSGKKKKKKKQSKLDFSGLNNIPKK